VAQEFGRSFPDVSLVWIGTSRSREQELCAKNDIPIKILNVKGMKRAVSPQAVSAFFSFVHEAGEMIAFFKRERFDAVVAFGGYVCAPVLLAARIRRVPYFLQEQNTVPGFVNRLFASHAVCTFLGFALSAKRRLKGACSLTGTPVRRSQGEYADFGYPRGFDRAGKSVLICGGSQGAASVNKCLIGPMKRVLDRGIQIVWQSGSASYQEVRTALSSYPNGFVFESIDDLYPFYARARIVIGRAGASTLNEIAYFGLPCVMIPLPWAAENHQWSNAGLVEKQGWGVRVAQQDGCGETVVDTVLEIISDTDRHERMCRKALDHSPAGAAEKIAAVVKQTLENKSAHSS